MKEKVIFTTALLYGTSSSQLSPNAGANRAQLAAFMMRTCELQSELDA